MENEQTLNPVMLENNLLNKVIIESLKGDRSFVLIKGDIYKDDGELIVVNTYEESGQIVGDFSNAKEKFKLTEAKERIVFFLENGGHISILESENPSDKKLLFLHSKLNESEQTSIDLYEEMIKGLFSALVSLEVSGYKFPTISLPVLLRKKIENIYNEAASVLINHASVWLKKSSFTHSIRYYVWVENDDIQWNAAIEHSLGRSPVNTLIDNELSDLRKYVLGELFTFPKVNSVYQDTIIPLQNGLNQDMISPEMIASFGRKLAESLCEMISGNSHDTFDKNLTLIKNNNLISDTFFLQCLYQIKAYGNTSIHPTKAQNDLFKINADDLKILLLILDKIQFEYRKRM